MSAREKVILLVEDAADDVFLFKRALAKVHLHNPVQPVPDVDEAIRYLEGSGLYAQRVVFPLPSIVIIDLHMPGKNGFDFLTWREARPEFKHLHVVVVSGVERMQEVSRAYQMGAHSFLTKPVKEEDLRNVANVFRQHWT